jgi:mono/diheme cytochrome c family protein
MGRSVLFLPLVTLLSAGCAEERTACAPDTDDGTSDTSGNEDTSNPDDTAPLEPNGQELFTDFCASCHGADARGGSERGIDRDVQNMPDADVVRIILNGAGEMAPVPVTEEEAYAIVGYIRTIVP